MTTQALPYILRKLRELEGLVQRIQTRERGFSRRATYKILEGDTFTADHHEFFLLYPETGTSDEVTQIDGGADGRKIVLAPQEAGHTFTVKTGVGNILLASDVELSSPDTTLALIYHTELAAWVAVGGIDSGGGGGGHSHPHNHDGDYVLLTDYEDSDVLDKIKNVDGSGSGLDADLLDGVDSTGFATAGHNHSGVYAPLSHNHSSSDITDFTEAAQDAVGVALTDSGTVDFTYDDGANTITAIVIDSSIANAKLANMDQATVKGRASGAGTGVPVDLSAAQLATIVEGSITHNNLSGLTTGDPHTQYVLLAGRSGGQNVRGGSGSGDNLTLESTSNATKGFVLLQPNGGAVGVGVTDPDGSLVKVEGVIGGGGRGAFFLNPTQGGGGGTQYGLLVGGIAASPGADNWIAIGIHGGTITNKKASIWISHTDANRPGINCGFANTVTAPALGAIFAGNVGIGSGASAPAIPLLVSTGSTRAEFDLKSSHTSGTIIRLVQDAAAAADRTLGAINFVNNAGATRAQIQAYYTGTDASLASMGLYTGGVERIRLHSGGNVGIGTGVQTPKSTLHVGAGTNTPATSATLYVSEAGTTNFVVRNSTNAVEAIYQCAGSSAVVGTVTNHPLRFFENNSEVARFNSGNLGIGPTSPQGKLHVHDSTGGFLFFTKTGITGTAQTIIPDGTGDVLHGILLMGVIRSTDNVYRQSTSMFIQNNQVFTYTLDIGTFNDQVQFTVSSAGAVTVARSNGSKTYEISMIAVWR